MTIAHWSLLAAFILPYAFALFAKARSGMKREDNHNPREFLAGLEGAQKRANWAQQNSYEVNPAFAAAVLVAQQVATAPQGTIDAIAMAFVVSRVLYGVCYIADWASARSAVWFAGIGCIVALFIVSA